MIAIDRAWLEFDPRGTNFPKLCDATDTPYVTLGTYIYTSHPGETMVRPGWVEKGCRWTGSLTLYGETSDGTVDRIYTFQMLLDERKVWLEEDAGRMHGIPRTKELCKFHEMLLDRLFFALALLQCREVELIVLPVPLDLLTTRLCGGAYPGVVYRTMMIHAIRQRARAERREGESEIASALRICRRQLAV